MKVLVVDDQQHVYKAVQLLVNWELYDVTEVLYASNGSEALEIMERDAPELVFTDMQMPVMDGPHFLQELRNKGFESEVIAVSGYNDFAYVMSLLHASGVEYLLKPIDEEELNEAVSKAVNRIWEKEKEKKSREEIVQIQRERNCQKIGAWLNGTVKFSCEIEESLEYMGIREEDYRMALFLINNPEKPINDMYDENLTEFQRDLYRITGDIFEKSAACHMFPVNSFMYYFLIQVAAYDEEEYCSCLNRMVRRLHKIMSVESMYVYSGRVGTIRQIPAVTNTLKSSIQLKTLQYTNGITLPVGSDADHAVDYHEGRISGLAYLLRMAVKEKDLETIGSIITEFCGGIRAKKEFSLYELQLYSTEVNLLLKKILAESREIGSFHLKQISPWIYDLDVWEMNVKEAFFEIASCHFEESLNITSVHAFILENYQKELSIPYLSERFNKSPQYLSKLYKNKYGETIGQTIKRTRMEKAKEYLRYSTIPAKEIALLTGFEDDNYFGKVFKKYCGISPQQYRKERYEK